jgi:hypothetical protein
MIRELINDIDKICDKYQTSYEIFILYLEIKKILEQINNKDILSVLDIHKFIDIFISPNNYTKYFIYKSDKFDLVLIKWNINSETKIHDHPNRGCIMKLLSGNIYEETYRNINNSDLQLLETNIYKDNDISYRIGKKILHKIKGINNAITLHVYIPGLYSPKCYPLTD